MATAKKSVNRQRRKIRIRARIQGTAKRPRLQVFRSLNHNYAQLIDDEKGVTLISTSDIKEKKSKDKKTDRAKKIGLELAKQAKEKKITTCVFDRNGYKFHGRIKAIAEGAREGGLKF